ncbi:peroxisomal membrane protein 11C isoform X4 [Choloepus didactylus]|uniref:peroxisomal membrane protein 11C isoform X4 n=1 Tax=Choloepus didactylus TaxID=27675 RepID=UPI00189F050C|nr:peroxisomal membrane protein 11C isoform X4 [Choloepus didactylus]
MDKESGKVMGEPGPRGLWARRHRILPPSEVGAMIRTLGYCCHLIGGVLMEQSAARSEVGTRLLALSTELSHCRTVLRLFDDLAMFAYTKQYGLGTKEEDVFVRWVSVLGNLADQLYYPCEHVAWAADTKVLHVDSARWWALSTALWGLSLLLGIAKAHLRSYKPQVSSTQEAHVATVLDSTDTAFWIPLYKVPWRGPCGWR